MSSLQQIVAFIKKQYPSKDFVSLHEPLFIGNERKYVQDAIDSTFVSSIGKYVNQFEEKMAEITGTKFAVATSNGTSALHMGLIVLGVQRNDEVLTQALSFVATSNAISYVGAEPVFLDVDLKTLGLSPKSVRAFLERYGEKKDGKCFNKSNGKRISACVPMHTFGHPCKIDEIISICNEWKIPVIEDAAESLGSFYRKQHTGSFGELAAFSFNGNKTVTCGGGGVLITNDEELAKRAKHLTTQAKAPHQWDYFHDSIGYNYRMPNLNAAMACAQLEMLDGFVENKRDLASEYEIFFESFDAFKFVKEPQNARSNYWLNAVLLESPQAREEFLEYTNGKGTMTRPIWKLSSELPMFEHCYNDGLSNSLFLSNHLVNIPSSVRQ